MFGNLDFDVIRRSLGYLFFDGMTFTLTLTALAGLGGLVFGTLIALIFLYFVSTEQGAFAIFDGMYVHEFVHDGRHLLGFPCH